MHLVLCNHRLVKINNNNNNNNNKLEQAIQCNQTSTLIQT